MKERLQSLQDGWRHSLTTPRAVVSAAALCALIVGHHFVLTALYVLPANAVSLATFPYVRWYMEPTFSQNWSLFAPDPTGGSAHFMVACRFEGESREEAVEHIAQPALPHESVQRRYRFSPGLRMARALTPVSLFNPSRDPYAALLEQKAVKNELGPSGQAVLELLEKAEDAASPIRMTTAARLSSYACAHEFPDRSTVEVYPMLLLVDPPPFSKRNDADAKPPAPRRMELGWFTYVSLADEDVVEGPNDLSQ